MMSDIASNFTTGEDPALGEDKYSHDNAYFNDPYNLSSAMMIVVTTLIIFGNILVIAVVCRTKTFSNASGLFMISLACADLGVGLFVTPFSIYPAIINKWPYGHPVCIMAAFFTELFSSVSVWSLAMIGVDRYLAIAKPLTYKQIMPPERAKIIIIVMWCLLSLLCIFPAVGVVNVMYYADLYVCNVAWEEELYYSVGVGISVILPSFTAIIYCYYHIFRIAHRAATQIATENDRLQQTQTSLVKRKRGAMMSLLIVASFCLSWTPWLALQIQESVAFAQNLENASEMEEHPHLPQLHFISMWIAFSNSFLNCIIYYLANKSFRLGAKRVFRTLCCKNRPPEGGSEDNINIWSVAVTMRRCES